MSKFPLTAAAAIDATGAIERAISEESAKRNYPSDDTVAPQIFCALLIERAIDRNTSAVRESIAAARALAAAIDSFARTTPEARR